VAHSIDSVDCVVIGAGVVGLAVARALALAGREVLVLEAQGAIGTGTSARNSEVIHAGFVLRARFTQSAVVRARARLALRLLRGAWRAA
jgi:Predicted dehydrogenase